MLPSDLLVSMFVYFCLSISQNIKYLGLGYIKEAADYHDRNIADVHNLSWDEILPNLKGLSRQFGYDGYLLNEIAEDLGDAIETFSDEGRYDGHGCFDFSFVPNLCDLYLEFIDTDPDANIEYLNTIADENLDLDIFSVQCDEECPMQKLMPVLINVIGHIGNKQPKYLDIGFKTNEICDIVVKQIAQCLESLRKFKYRMLIHVELKDFGNYDASKFALLKKLDAFKSMRISESGVIMFEFEESDIDITGQRKMKKIPTSFTYD